METFADAQEISTSCRSVGNDVCEILYLIALTLHGNGSFSRQQTDIHTSDTGYRHLTRTVLHRHQIGIVADETRRIVMTANLQWLPSLKEGDMQGVALKTVGKGTT